MRAAHLVLVALLSNVVPAAVVSGEPGGDAAPDSTARCSTLGTVCVATAAFGSVVCTYAGYRVIQCTAATAHGAGGLSPAPFRLPGDVSWSGSAHASGDCSAAGSARGSASWPGFPGAVGGESARTVALCTKARFVPPLLTGCVRLTAIADTTATARSRAPVAGVIIESVSDTRSGQASDEICLGR